MKIKLMVEVAFVFLVATAMGVWQNWLKWPEGALIAAALCLVTTFVVWRGIQAQRPPKE